MAARSNSDRYENGDRCTRSPRRGYSITWNIFVVNSIFLFVLSVLSFNGCGVTGLSIDTEQAKKSESVATDVIPNQPGTLFGHDQDGNGITLGNWLDYGTLLVGVTLAGQMYLALLGLVPIYYALFVVTDPAELQRRSGRSEKNSSNLSTGSNYSWNLQRVVKMITLAYETYQQLDMSEMDCQKKLLCELQQGKDIAATTTRTLSNVLLYFDFFKRIPHMEDYREAIKNGQRRISSRSTADHCSTFYSKCKFSITEFNEKYRRLLST